MTWFDTLLSILDYLHMLPKTNKGLVVGTYIPISRPPYLLFPQDPINTYPFPGGDPFSFPRKPPGL